MLRYRLPYDPQILLVIFVSTKINKIIEKSRTVKKQGLNAIPKQAVFCYVLKHAKY